MKDGLKFDYFLFGFVIKSVFLKTFLNSNSFKNF